MIQYNLGMEFLASEVFFYVSWGTEVCVWGVGLLLEPALLTRLAEAGVKMLDLLDQRSHRSFTRLPQVEPPLDGLMLSFVTGNACERLFICLDCPHHG